MNDLFDEYEYAIAPGWNADDEDMVLIHDLLGQPPVTQPPDEYPIRRRTLDQREWGDGPVDHELDFLDFIPVAKVGVIKTVFFSGGTVVSVAVTLRVRHHDLGIYRKYNCWAIRPQEGVDYTILDYMVEDELVCSLRWRFNRLIRIPDPEP